MTHRTAHAPEDVSGDGAAPPILCRDERRSSRSLRIGAIVLDDRIANIELRGIELLRSQPVESEQRIGCGHTRRPEKFESSAAVKISAERLNDRSAIADG